MIFIRSRGRSCHVDSRVGFAYFFCISDESNILFWIMQENFELMSTKTLYEI